MRHVSSDGRGVVCSPPPHRERLPRRHPWVASVGGVFRELLIRQPQLRPWFAGIALVVAHSFAFAIVAITLIIVTTPASDAFATQANMWGWCVLLPVFLGVGVPLLGQALRAGDLYLSWWKSALVLAASWSGMLVATVSDASDGVLAVAWCISLCIGAALCALLVGDRSPDARAAKARLAEKDPDPFRS